MTDRIDGLCYDSLDAVVQCSSVPEHDCIEKEFWHKDWSVCDHGAKCKEVVVLRPATHQLCKEVLTFCSWCGRMIHDGRRVNGNVSHGICASCAKNAEQEGEGK
jgi:hypothetical protein